MASTTEIANLALAHLGVGKAISTLDTEQSEEARVCRLFYDIARDATLKDFPWPFATAFAAVGLVEEDPTDEWAFSYRVPSDCLHVRRILSGTRNETRQTRVPYKLGVDSAGGLLYTDAEDAEIEYTVRQDDPGRYPADFVLAFSERLSAYVAPRLTAGDPFKLSEKVLRLYFLEMSNARANAVNEQQDEELPKSELERARE